MLDKKLLDILACPKCQGELTFDNKMSQLTCDDCKLGFDIEDSIPVLLVEQATDLTKK